MAQREVVVMIDDLDLTESPEVRTVEFAFDGRTFEIDLTPENRERFAGLVQPFIDAGRQTGGKRKWSRRTRSEASDDDARASA